ncbi:MAG: GNAT family N-acetyltransferase [Hyphomicrobiaceae bacterium]|nr:GNAT family N-acetyltransferase [Hyphomicrobiaceae bacterium]MCC0007491.1 GNAT family N-acetyltransferase [Hyphomicrobiaceae bacterium]
MALLRTSKAPDPAPIIRGQGVMLRAPSMTDYPAWAELRALSREHLTPWEPLWARDELSRSAFRRRIRHYQREAREDLGYAFFIHAAPQPPSASRRFGHHATVPSGLPTLAQRQPIFARLSGALPPLVGGVTLTNVRRGVTQSATLGYWLGVPYVGHGLMHDALSALLPFAFDVLRLHRVEAAVMPANAPSLKLLDRLGFTREGVARRYLKINGVWQDHIAFALLAEDVGRADGGSA